MRTTFFLLLLSTFAIAAEPSTTSPERVAITFFAYLENNRRDISSDGEAQEKFLSTSLREAVGAAIRYDHLNHSRSGEMPNPPLNNSCFLLAWDPPKRFSVTRTLQTPYTAIVAGRCIWIAGQQYEHEIRPTFFIMVFERGAWRVSDIQAAKANFNSDMSLLAELKRPAK